jgi:hypothetical protein
VLCLQVGETLFRGLLVGVPGRHSDSEATQYGHVLRVDEDTGDASVQLYNVTTTRR